MLGRRPRETKGNERKWKERTTSNWKLKEDEKAPSQYVCSMKFVLMLICLATKKRERANQTWMQIIKPGRHQTSLPRCFAGFNSILLGCRWSASQPAKMKWKGDPPKKNNCDKVPFRTKVQGNWKEEKASKRKWKGQWGGAIAAWGQSVYSIDDWCSYYCHAKYDKIHSLRLLFK